MAFFTIKPKHSPICKSRSVKGETLIRFPLKAGAYYECVESADGKRVVYTRVSDPTTPYIQEVHLDEKEALAENPFGDHNPFPLNGSENIPDQFRDADVNTRKMFINMIEKEASIEKKKRG